MGIFSQYLREDEASRVCAKFGMALFSRVSRAC